MQTKDKQNTILTMSIYQNVGNEEMPKRPEVPLQTTCPCSNVTRYGCLSVNAYNDVAVKGFRH